MKLCSRCKKRPAVVFVANAADTNSEPDGLCLVCAKELGIKPIDDMLKKMNITDDDIELMSDQFMDLMSLNEENENDDAELNDETFDEREPLTIFDPEHTFKRMTLTDYHMRCLLYTSDAADEL